MCKVIAIANQKGGVGKTTTCVNLGIGLAREGKRVLLIEADAQGSMAASLGIQEPDELEVTLVTIMEKVINDEDVQALEKVQPKELEASEIEIRLGATWVDAEYITEFMGELFQTPDYYLGSRIEVKYAPVNGQWNISGKSLDTYGNTRVTATYGTARANAYRLLEDALNLRDTKIYDTIQDADGEHRVLNKKETMLAQQKQDMIKEAFKEWIFRDIDRREALCKKYNEIFNSIRPREYDGSHIQFVGMTPEITLMPHQKNAVAHVLYGGNTLLAHCVGAGKTFQMIAAGMESKRLGLSQKNLYVVPNHLTEQWGSDFLRLYPGANVLVSTKKDFEPANRKKFCSRICGCDTKSLNLTVLAVTPTKPSIPLDEANIPGFASNGIVRKRI